jgi:hypothetical protein
MRELYTVGDGTIKVKTRSIWIYTPTYFAMCTFSTELVSHIVHHPADSA